MKFIYSTLVLLICFSATAQLAEKEDNVLIVKFSRIIEKGIVDDDVLSMEELGSGLRIGSCIKMFERNGQPNESPYLKNIFRITLEGSYSLDDVIFALQRYDNVIYATLSYMAYTMEVPNDPFAAIGGLQDHLEVIKAYDAWDINKGDTSVVIGLIDGAVDYTHEDLAANLQVNRNDPINGFDDDNNGYIDDYYGYDFADRDNDPTSDALTHGMSVAGISAGVTNNRKGIAGTGYNSRYAIMKIIPDDNSRTIRNGYEAIVYAADQGYDVINLSWGGAGRFSQFQQDVINYAVLEKNVVVIAAAGNTPDELEFYPASYENVLSVGATDINDLKAQNSTYSYKIDLMAPAENVYTTGNNNGYRYSGFGTSFAAPQVAGAAALVKHHFPNFDAKQVMERLRVTADPIDNIGTNTAFAGKLGNGRLNMFNALSAPQRPSIRFERLSFDAPFDGHFFFGDTIAITGTFTNYLAATSEGKVIMTSESQYAEVIEGEIALGQLITQQKFSNDEFPFVIALSEDAPANERIALKLTYSDNNDYRDFEYVLIYTAPDHLDVGSKNLTLTVSSSGKLARGEDNDQTFSFKGEKLVGSMGVLIADANQILYDNSVTDKANNQMADDFSTVQRIKRYTNTIADRYGYSIFEAFGSTNQPLIIEQNLASFSEDSNAMLLEYRIINNSAEKFDSMTFGLLADFDIGNDRDNSSGLEEVSGIGYAFGSSRSINKNDIYTGVKLLSDQPVRFNTFDFDETGSSLQDDVKFSMLTSSSVTKAHLNADVFNTYGVYVGDIDAYESKTVSFAILGGHSLANLVDASTQIEERFMQWRNMPPVYAEATLCEDESLSLPLPDGFAVYSDIDLNNRIDDNSVLTASLNSSDTSFYIIDKNTPYNGRLERIVVKASQVRADFRFSQDTLLLGGSTNNRIDFYANTSNVATYEWTLAQGLRSSRPAPFQTINQVGTYTIALLTTDVFGCKDSITKVLVVADPGVKPELEKGLTICQNTQASVVASNTNLIKVYEDSTRQNPVYIGRVFQTPKLSTSTIYYVTNLEGEFESIPVPVFIEVEVVKANFQVTPDLSMDASANSILISDKSSHSIVNHRWFVDGTNIGNDSVASTVISQGNVNLRYIAETENGCKDTISSDVNFRRSITIPQQNRQVCANESYELIPEGGTFFSFYADPNKELLLGKGKSLLIDEVRQGRTVYVSNLDEFIEGDLRPIEITPMALPEQIRAVPESLSFSTFNRNATFDIPENEGNVLQWFINGSFFQSSDQLIILFDSAGTYQIESVVSNAIGCKDTLSMNYDVLSLVTALQTDQNEIVVSPNPFDESVSIEFTDKGSGIIDILSLSGITLNRFERYPDQHYVMLNLGTLSSGVYLIRYTKDDGTMGWIRSIVKR